MNYIFIVLIVSIFLIYGSIIVSRIYNKFYEKEDEKKEYFIEEEVDDKEEKEKTEIYEEEPPTYLEVVA